jgi:D-alanine-D-alanine ligase-like ATP-grasp enzyme
VSIPQPIAILYQALPPPVIKGLRKEAKPGGYSDSGADIGFCLRERGLKLVTPVEDADPTRQMDWVFPDTAEGIENALARGAALLWANTVLFTGHPLKAVLSSAWIVGQHPVAQEAADDKFVTNALLRDAGLPVPASILAAPNARPGVHALSALTNDVLDAAGLRFPMVVKPVRGRGSQGVSVVRDHASLVRAAGDLIASGRFGEDLIVEAFLSGAEMTVTVLPKKDGGYVALPPVLRFDQHDDVAPYNGLVAVTKNSRALTPAEQTAPAVVAMMERCITAAGLMGSRAAARIDCREDEDGVMALFDANLKPNLTGAGRPGRDDQDSLTMIAARALGWSYGDLVEEILRTAWRD